MTVLTMYFAGSGHGIDKSIDDDSMVEAYNQTMGCKAFFPGPGGDPRIYVAGFDGELLRRQLNVGKELASDEHGTLFGYNAKLSERGVKAKRALTGKGWDRNVWFALNLLAAQLKSDGGRLTLNLVGHSRGSITVIMLLNDMFFEHVGQGLGAGQRFSFKEAGVHAQYKATGAGNAGFGAWYRKQLEAVWLRRMGTSAALSRRLAKQGIAALETVKQHQGNFDAINAWLFDPVAGVNEGASSRKQQFPAHPLIKRVRVLRMEQGGAGGLLSTNMPTFPGWSFLDGLHGPRNLAAFQDRERCVIPLPGSHGSGLSINIDEKKGVGVQTREQWYIGTSYMVHLLAACGTQFEPGFVERWHHENLLLAAYNTLFDRFQHVPAGHGELNPARGRIHHAHHTPEGYVVDAVNAHHAYLKQQHPHFPK
jgi:hypothetical protein